MKNKCCICGKEFEGYGNNPYPVMSGEKCCCDECNDLVIFTRQLYYPEGYDSKNVIFADTPAEDQLAEYKTVLDEIKSVSDRFYAFVTKNTGENC